MAEIVFTEGFMADAAIVEREEKLDEILDTIALLEDAPEIGSAILPASIRRRYGSQVRKLVVRPFDIIYDYLPKDDAVVVLTLIHQRGAR
ncbi:type II toxin-antitoxin system RelE/ParE family toxin [Adlercreutzia equolifaciens]|uniref:type II toxin-antitoxin system RelE/ParE family toxin n=1 Tax=Adlercreutzia equolifaciens TaxID=446660 RepID=UPI00258CC3D6|nr:type II toxin-antitoxin system RelE/ParE family toxin [Adlercreutzia equolifaciens]MDR3996182.1 type II toxin-antitoxin system RelE/ParE family toxin [Adlercreutzia sp.]